MKCGQCTSATVTLYWLSEEIWVGSVHLRAYVLAQDRKWGHRAWSLKRGLHVSWMCSVGWWKLSDCMRATAAADEIYLIRYGSNGRGQGWFSIDGQFKHFFNFLGINTYIRNILLNRPRCFINWCCEMFGTVHVFLLPPASYIIGTINQKYCLETGAKPIVLKYSEFTQ